MYYQRLYLLIHLRLVVVPCCSTNVCHGNTAQLSPQSKGFNHCGVHAFERQEPIVSPLGPKQGVDVACCTQASWWRPADTRFVNYWTLLFHQYSVSILRSCGCLVSY